MADAKFTELPAGVAIADTDLVALAQDIGGTPISRSAAASLFKAYVNPFVTKQEPLTIDFVGDTSFTLTETPAGQDALAIYVNRIRYFPPLDFTLAGKIVTWNDPGGFILDPDRDKIWAVYNFSAPSNIKPGFVARTDATIPGVTGDGVAKTVIFETEDADTQNVYDHTTGIFTANRPGIYLFSSTLYLDGVTALQTTLDMQILTTGQTPFIWWIDPTEMRYGASDEVLLTGGIPLVMQAGDTAELVLKVTGEATKTVDVRAASYFSGILLTDI